MTRAALFVVGVLGLALYLVWIAATVLAGSP